MPVFTFTANPTGYDVTAPDAGPIGTLEREIRANKRWWTPVTPDGDRGRATDSRDAAAAWLHVQAAPALYTRTPAPDPILDAIRRHISAGNPEQAAAVLHAALAEDLANMRARRRTSPAAVWQHLDRYSSWLAEVTAAERVPSALPARLAHLHAL